MKCSRHNSLLTYNYLLVLSCHQHQSGCFWLRYAPNRLSAWASPQTPLGSLQCSSRPLAGLGGGAPGKGRRERRGKEGREVKGRKGRESRNAQIQSWQAYILSQNVCPSVCPSHAGIVLKHLKISSNLFHHRVATPFRFFYTKHYGNIVTDLRNGASNARV